MGDIVGGRVAVAVVLEGASTDKDSATVLSPSLSCGAISKGERGRQRRRHE